MTSARATLATGGLMTVFTGCVEHASIQGVGELPTQGLLAWAMFILVGVLIIYAVDLATQVVWRVGFDSERRLYVSRRWLRLVVAVVWGVVGLRDVIALQPALSPVISVIIGSLGLIALARPVQNLFGGVMILLEGRLQVGDHVEVKGVEGAVESVGLMQLRVRDAGGQTLLVPSRLFNETIVTVSRSTRLVPAVGRVPLQGAPHPLTLDRVRAMTLLLPWRVSGTPVRVWVDGGCLAAEIQTWGPDAVRPAAIALEKLLTESIEAQNSEAPSP